MSSKVCAEMPRNTQKYNIGNGLMVNVSEGLLGRGATLRSFINAFMKLQFRRKLQTDIFILP